MHQMHSPHALNHNHIQAPLPPSMPHFLLIASFFPNCSHTLNTHLSHYSQSSGPVLVSTPSSNPSRIRTQKKWRNTRRRRSIPTNDKSANWLRTSPCSHFPMSQWPLIQLSPGIPSPGLCPVCGEVAKQLIPNSSFDNHCLMNHSLLKWAR